MYIDDKPEEVSLPYIPPNTDDSMLSISTVTNEDQVVAIACEYEDRIEYVPLDPRNGDLARVRAKWESMEEKPFEIDWDSIYLADKFA